LVLLGIFGVAFVRALLCLCVYYGAGQVSLGGSVDLTQNILLCASCW